MKLNLLEWVRLEPLIREQAIFIISLINIQNIIIYRLNNSITKYTQDINFSNSLARLTQANIIRKVIL